MNHSSTSNSKQPSIFTSRDSFLRTPHKPVAPARTSPGRLGSPLRRQSTPDCLEQNRIQAAAGEGLSGPGTLSLATSRLNSGVFWGNNHASSAHPASACAAGYTGKADTVGKGEREQEQRKSTVLPQSASATRLNPEATTARPSLWASLAPGELSRGSPGARARSASVSQAQTGSSLVAGDVHPTLFRTPGVVPANSPQRDSHKRKRRDAGAEGVASEPPASKRTRFRGPRTKHTLDGLTFGPSTFNQPALQPPSPLFFSNSPRPRPQLPPRFSSSEAAARMLSKAREQDSHVTTVSLARGTITTPGSTYPPPSFTPTSVPRSADLVGRRSLDRSSTGRSHSPDAMSLSNSNSNSGGGGSGNEAGPMGGMLNNIGVIELLEQDERPTFIVDLADSTNFGPGALHTLFANSSLRSYHGMHELVTGSAPADDDGASPGPKTYLQFKSWLLSASINGESLNVCLPSFVYAGLTWSCSTLRKRLRIVGAAFNATPPDSRPGQQRRVSMGPASLSAAAAAAAPGDMLPEAMTSGSLATEPTDYFGSAVAPEQQQAAAQPSRSAADSTKAIPTIEPRPPAPTTTTTDLIAIRHPRQDLSSATDLLPQQSFNHTYVKARRAAASDDPETFRESSVAGSVDSGHSRIDIVASDAPSFDWTRLPITDNMPRHIRFARGVDWARTSLGPIEEWSSDLRQMCNLIMASPHPAAMYWGADLIAIYNEAYIMLAGQKHPKLMGQPYSVAWAEIWHDVKDVFASAQSTGEATMKDDDCLFIKRHDYLEETYFSWSIIPMVGREGSVMGLYNPAFEKTRRKIAERRMLTLREVGERTASARDVKGFWAQVLGSFEFNEYDSPFLLLYSVADEADSDSSSIHSNSVFATRQCFLEGALGVPVGHAAAPEQIDLKAGMEGFGPVFREVMTADRPVLLEVGSRDLPQSLLEGMKCRGFGDLVRAVVVCPIHPTTGENALGFLVLGVNPRRPYDDDYSLFVQLLCRQLATSLASVVLFEEEIRRGQKAAKLAALDRIELSEQLAARTQEAIESETKFTRMAEFAPVGMFIADHSGRITFANDTWYDISGVSRDHSQATVDEQWLEAVLPADRLLVQRLWADLVVDTKPVSSEIRFRTKWEDRSGTRGDTWCLFSAYPETYPRDGRLKSVFGSITNISQQKWAEGLQTRKMEEAVELKRQQENFIDITSHEMRNPLSAILQCSDEISSALGKFRQGEERVIPDEVLTSCLDAAQIISLCSQHQKRIVDDILTLSKLDSALLLVTPVDAQPLTVVQRALKMHEGELQAADIQMKFVVDDTFRAMELDWVRLDPSRVLQVLINLTTNAIKFTGTEKKRTITVTIAASRQKPSEMERPPVNYFPTRKKVKDSMSERDWGDGELVYILFSVQDTGRGLNDEEKKMLFLRFSQASPRTHVQYGGSGLGLFISRELTELQGGEIGVESEAGKGSTFAFYIAARRSTAPPDTDGGTGMKRADAGARGKNMPSATVRGAGQKLEGPLPGKAVANGSPLAPVPKRVLIVEDNLVNQRVLHKQLKNLGTEVHLANHGGEALEKLRQSTYWAGEDGGKLELGVVLMDQEMPVMDGLTCTRKIRELEQEGKLTGHVPIIAVTANARAEQVQTALNAGMDDVVSKPFRIPELMPKIEELMERYPMPSAAASSSSLSAS